MRRIQLIIMGLLMMLMVSACGASAEAPAAGIEETAKEEQTEDQKEAIVDQTASGKKEDHEETIPVNEVKTFNIYYSNEMADGLEKTQIETDTLSPELLLSNLSNYNIVSRDTKVLSSEVVEERGEKMLLLPIAKSACNILFGIIKDICNFGNTFFSKQ